MFTDPDSICSILSISCRRSSVCRAASEPLSGISIIADCYQPWAADACSFKDLAGVPFTMQCSERRLVYLAGMEPSNIASYWSSCSDFTGDDAHSSRSGAVAVNTRYMLAEHMGNVSDFLQDRDSCDKARRQR